jgi:chitin synthase
VHIETDPNVAVASRPSQLTSIAKTHQVVIPIVKEKAVLQYGGLDASSLFPVQVSALCDGIDGTVSPWVQINSLNSSASTDTNAVYHDFRAFTNDSRPDWYFEQMIYMRYTYRLGFVGILPKTIKKNAGDGDAVAVYDSHVYDITDYIRSPPYLRTPAGTQAGSGVSTQFLAPQIIQLFQQQAGKDITKRLDALVSDGVLDAATLQRQLTCLRNLCVASPPGAGPT